MHRTSIRIVAAAAAVAMVACAEGTAPGFGVASSLLSQAFLTAAPGYENLSSSYAASGNTGIFAPNGDRSQLGANLMAGGLHDDFAGAVGFGGGRRGPFGSFQLDSSCVFSSATGRVTCADVTRDGLTISRSFAFSDAAGKAQAAFDTATTNTVNSRSAVTGTRSWSNTAGAPEGHHGFGPDHHHGGGPLPAGDTISSASTTVKNTSDQTVTGLAKGSTQRTVNGTSSGQETTTGTATKGAFTSSRTMGDTTKALVIPVSTTGPSYPTSGTVIRSMKATVTYNGSTSSTSRREVVTYDGSATAKVVIVQNDTTRNCTMPLPHGRLTCQ